MESAVEDEDSQTAHHANYRLQEFISRNLHPRHLDGLRISRRAGGQEVIHDHIGVVPGRPSYL